MMIVCVVRGRNCYIISNMTARVIAERTLITIHYPISDQVIGVPAFYQEVEGVRVFTVKDIPDVASTTDRDVIMQSLLVGAVRDGINAIYLPVCITQEIIAFNRDPAKAHAAILALMQTILPSKYRYFLDHRLYLSFARKETDINILEMLEYLATIPSETLGYV